MGSGGISKCTLGLVLPRFIARSVVLAGYGLKMLDKIIKHDKGSYL